MAIDREKLLQAAQKLVESGRLSDAVLEYERLVAAEPSDARILLTLGDLYLKLRRFADSIAAYERVGQAYAQAGMALKAIAVFKQIRGIVQKHAPELEDAVAHITPRLAELYAELGLTSDALAAYDEAGTRLQRVGRELEAIDVFKKVVDLDPANPLPHLRLADALVRVKDFDAAAERLGAAGDILRLLGRRDDALKVLERLFQVRPSAKFARMAAQIYLDRGHPKDAMAALTRLQFCFKEDPKDLDTLVLLARSFEAIGQPKKAIEVQKEAALVATEVGREDVLTALLAALAPHAQDDADIRSLLSAPRSFAKSGASGFKASLEPKADEGRAAVGERRDRNGPTSLDVEISSTEITPVERPLVPAIGEGGVDASAEEHPFDLVPSQPVLPDERSELDDVAWTKSALARGDALRRARDFEAAIEVLRTARLEQPGVRELREKLCDVLIEAERAVDAVEELLDFANYLWAMGDIAGAARVLDEVLLLDPEQGEALAMLGALGYAVPGLGDDASGSGEAAPLSTYDIESVGAGRVLGWSVTEPATQAPLEEPFDEPIFASEDDVDFAIANEDTAPTQPAPARDGSDHGIDAELLAEVDFFLNAGLLDDARALLDEQAQLTPENPELFARFEELARRDAAARPREEARAVEGDPSFAVAASLAERAGASGGLSADGRQVSVDGVLAQFKAGIAAEIHASDSATHYDLGLTYREMGLAREALDAFLLAAQDPMRACECHFLIGTMRVDAGEFDLAIGSFLRGLEVVERTVEQELTLRYELAHTSAQMGDAERAVAHFERVRALRPGYGDTRGTVEARLAELGASSCSDAEIDAALDELSRRGSIR